MIDYSVYLVDDEVSVIKGLEYGLKNLYSVKIFGTAETALEAVKKSPPDLVLLDIGLPGMSGLEALCEIKAVNQQTIVIMITAYEDIDTVICAMKSGAYDYVVKPINLDAIKVCINNALETVRLQKEVQALQEKYLRENMPCFVSESNVISDIMLFVEKAAKSSDTPIMITGESGTGKEIIASAIHYKSPNYKGAFVPINCASIPKDLIESELFGYEKGSFSGASPGGKKGMIEQAEGGTLFLDEMGDLCLDAQAKLLRFLENGTFYRIGGTKAVTVKTRIVSATNKDLDEMVRTGAFRLDLYYRIGVVKVQIPSLNQRVDDIMPIARYFLVEFSKKMGKSFTGISKEAESYLKQHRWRGNVRELKNMIERAVLIEDGPELRFQGLDIIAALPELKDEDARAIVDSAMMNGQSETFCSLDQMISSYIIKVLDKTNGRIEGDGGASEILDVNPSTLRSRMRKLNITCHKKTDRSCQSIVDTKGVVYEQI